MILKTGKFYKTRCGKKAYVFYKFKKLFTKEEMFLVAVENERPYEVYKDGSKYIFEVTGWDLVSEITKTPRNRKELRERILKLLEEGKTYSEIKSLTGAAHTTIARARRNGNYKVPHYDRKKTIEKYKRCIEDKMSLSEIAKKLHKSVNAVTWYIYSTEELRELKMRYDQRKRKSLKK